jgi:hypothetical protein
MEKIMTTDLWLMVGLVVALLLGNLWLLKRNSKQQLKRSPNVHKPARTAQTGSAAPASAVLTTTDSRNDGAKDSSITPSGKADTDSSPAHADSSSTTD